MPAAETKRDGKGEFLAKDLSIWRQTPGPGADAGSGSRIQVDVSSLKVKVASSIIAISSIHLLGAFMAISPGENRGGLISVAQLAQVKWLVIIHATLIISALILALIDWLSPHGKKKDTSATM